MNRTFSIYLDLVRFGAAVLVYLWHSNMRMLVQDILPASNYGHSAVIVFFVLSGFVIAFVTDTKEKTWVAYSASRLSRVYSVVLPTLILTPLLDAFGRQLYPAMYDYPFDRFALRLLGCGLMLNESWWVSITFFSNVPYWSIAFEFWYYVIFALVMFVPRGWRVWAVLAACTFVGPKIVLLLPVWWAGVLLYRWRWLQTWSPGVSWALVLLSTAGIVLMHAAGVYEMVADLMRGWVGADRFRELTFARFVLGDYLLGLLVFVPLRGRAQRGGALGAAAAAHRAPGALGGRLHLHAVPDAPAACSCSGRRSCSGDPKGHGFWWMVTALTALSVVAHRCRHRAPARCLAALAAAPAAGLARPRASLRAVRS